MKKLALFFSVAVIAISCSSCLKSYTCTCVNNNTGASSTVSVTAANTTDAALKCASQTQGGTSTCAY
jgi:hypothetical protein